MCGLWAKVTISSFYGSGGDLNTGPRLVQQAYYPLSPPPALLVFPSCLHMLCLLLFAQVELNLQRIDLVTSVVLETWEDRFLHHHPLPTLGLWSRHTKMVASPLNGTCFLKKRTKHRLPSLFTLPHMTRCVPESRQEWMPEDRCVGS